MFPAHLIQSEQQDEKSAADSLGDWVAEIPEEGNVGLLQSQHGIGPISTALGFAESLKGDRVLVLWVDPELATAFVDFYLANENDGCMGLRSRKQVEIQRNLLSTRNEVRQEMERLKQTHPGVLQAAFYVGKKDRRVEFILEGCCCKIQSQEAYLLSPEQEIAYLARATTMLYECSGLPVPGKIVCVEKAGYQVIAQKEGDSQIVAVFFRYDRPRALEILKRIILS